MNQQLIERTYSETKLAVNSIQKKRKSTQIFQKLMWTLTGLYFIFMMLILFVHYFPELQSKFATFFNLFKASTENPYANIYPIVGLFVLLYPTTYIFAKRFADFKTKESAAVSKMVKLLFPKVEFSLNTSVPNKEIVKSKLFTWVNKGAPIYSYGQIRSSIDDKSINIADVGIVEDNISSKFMQVWMRIPGLNMFAILYQYVLKNIISKKSADNVYYTFRGMFCWLKFDKKLQGHTVLLSNNQGNKLDRYINTNFKAEQKVNLEDHRFNDEFIVYSTDQVEARYVLSLDLMERIVALKNKFKKPIMLSFQNQQMYLAISNESGLFSFPAGKLDTIEVVEELAHNIETALKITTELKLK
ncbi:MAG: hypothetical protein ACI9N1_000084 [Flavobacteriales bacterium]